MIGELTPAALAERPSTDAGIPEWTAYRDARAEDMRAALAARAVIEAQLAGLRQQLEDLVMAGRSTGMSEITDELWTIEHGPLADATEQVLMTRAAHLFAEANLQKLVMTEAGRAATQAVREAEEASSRAEDARSTAMRAEYAWTTAEASERLVGQEIDDHRAAVKQARAARVEELRARQ